MSTNNMPWNPAEKPYRIRKIFKTSRSGCYGWHDRCICVASLDEALATMNEKMNGSCCEIQIDFAIDGTTKGFRSWKKIANRKRNQVAVHFK